MLDRRAANAEASFLREVFWCRRLQDGKNKR